ncbi:MAG: flavin reductase family protein, partial [Pseudomonadota bacterium]
MNADANLNLDALNKQALKNAMGCFATGVTVVTTNVDGQDYGMTCNSFNTVSLDPALVLWSIRKESHSRQAFIEGGGYSVSVLGAHQRDMALRFAKGDPLGRFDGVPVVRLPSGRLMLADTVAWFDCTLEQVIDAGDHHVLIG